MQQNGEWSSPVIIGGVGGSGTRVVAEIISQFDPADLSELENLGFSTAADDP